jgi:hypothetical protein
MFGATTGFGVGGTPAAGFAAADTPAPGLFWKYVTHSAGTEDWSA